MTRNWEEQFREWAKPPGQTEQDRCDNAESAIRNAIKTSDKLRARGVSVFSQGSYRNNTNVRQDSDVDIGVLCNGVFFYDPLPEGLTPQLLGFSDSTYKFDQYKNEVEEALVNYFGRSAVTRGNKAFDIHETSYHVEADVAPFFEHRRYSADGNHLKGVALLTDKESMKIINWPEQHYDNGCQKNKDTGTRFKSIVRVLKALSNEMTENGVGGGTIPGFLIECLVWNVPSDNFQNPTYTADVKVALNSLYQHTEMEDSCRQWREVSKLKPLFAPGQKWTREQANAFTVSAWNYAGLGKQA